MTILKAPKYSDKDWKLLHQFPKTIKELHKILPMLKQHSDYHKQQKSYFNALASKYNDKFYHRNGELKEAWK